MTDSPAVTDVLARIREFEGEAKAILGSHEESSARVVTLGKSYEILGLLSLKQDELFREALRAVEVGLFRAAHVLAWAGFIDFLHHALVPTHVAALLSVESTWKITAPEDCRDYSDFGLIDAARRSKVIDKTTAKALHGLLNKRNECAHPTDHFPDLNQSLGYVSELFSRIDALRRTL